MPEQSRELYQLIGSKSVQEIEQKMNFILNRIADRLDKMEGLRGTPAFYKSEFDFLGDSVAAGQVLKATSSSRAEVATLESTEVNNAVSSLASGETASVDLKESLISMIDFENDEVIHQIPAHWFNINGEVQGFFTHEDPSQDASYGTVTGPSVSADSNIAEFNGTGGQIIKDGGLSHADAASAISLKHTQNTDTALNGGYVGAQLIDGGAVLVKISDFNNEIIHEIPLEWLALCGDVFAIE